MFLREPAFFRVQEQPQSHRALRRRTTSRAGAREDRQMNNNGQPKNEQKANAGVKVRSQRANGHTQILFTDTVEIITLPAAAGGGELWVGIHSSCMPPVPDIPARPRKVHSRPVLVVGRRRGGETGRVLANHAAAPPDRVAAALERLGNSITGGVEALVLPMGVGGVVATDAARGVSYHAEVEHFADGPVADLLTDPRPFFREWVRWWSRWGHADHLRAPVLAVTLRALQALGRAQGWRNTEFRVTGRKLDV
jgi:hypothetical protein